MPPGMSLELHQAAVNIHQLGVWLRLILILEGPREIALVAQYPTPWAKVEQMKYPRFPASVSRSRDMSISNNICDFYSDWLRLAFENSYPACPISTAFL